MPSSKTLIKFVFVLIIWSFLIIGLIKLHNQSEFVQNHTNAPIISKWQLLQKENIFAEATLTTAHHLQPLEESSSTEASSNTADHLLPLDVLIDDREGIIYMRIFKILHEHSYIIEMILTNTIINGPTRTTFFLITVFTI